MFDVIRGYVRSEYNIRSTLIGSFALFTVFLILLILWSTSYSKLNDSRFKNIYHQPEKDTATTKILVLATTHLSKIEENYSPGQLDSLILVLEKFNPGVIAVEDLPGRQIQAFDSWNSPLKKMFGETSKKYGNITQKHLNTSWPGANNHADSLLNQISNQNEKVTDELRLHLVENLVAAYRLPTASLQWSYISDSFRQEQESLPDTVSTILEQSLKWANEIYSIGTRLARNLHLQQLYPVDDHSEKDILLSIRPQLQKGLDKSLRRELQNSHYIQKNRSLLKKGIQTNNLMPLYRFLNSSAYLEPDVEKQWKLFLRTPMPAKANRSRLALWETRNLHIAANIQRSSAQNPTESVLVIIGASHKYFLDKYLNQMMGVEVVQLDDFTK